MSIEHTDVAAYSLGLLDAADREEFEAHLAGCEACAAELSEFAAMADLFAGLDPVTVSDEQPDESAVTDLLARRAGQQRRRNRQRGWLAAAACLVLLGGGLATGLAAAPGTAPGTVSMVGQQHTGTNPSSGLTATVGLAPHLWGTQVVLELGRVRGPLDCQLIAVSKSGERRVIVGWLVPASGFGVPSNPAELLIEGGTSIPMTDLASIDIQVVNGPTLLKIPVLRAR